MYMSVRGEELHPGRNLTRQGNISVLKLTLDFPPQTGPAIAIALDVWREGKGRVFAERGHHNR